jgi:hypothetical protein
MAGQISFTDLSEHERHPKQKLQKFRTRAAISWHGIKQAEMAVTSALVAEGARFDCRKEHRLS